MSNDPVTVDSYPPIGGGDPTTEFEALQRVISALQSVGDEARARILHSAATFLDVTPVQMSSAQVHQAQASPRIDHRAYSDDTSMSPKDFILDKQPRTDVERIACLAYYLTHYRETPHFKTIDISKLNTEAAQPKFSNAAVAASNAIKTGYLVPSTKGHRQLSAAGERFVQALPDRDAARAAMSSIRKRRKPKRGSRSSPSAK